MTEIRLRTKSALLATMTGYMCLFVSVMLYLIGEFSNSFSTIQYAILLISIFYVLKYGNRDNAAAFTFFACFAMFLLNRVFLSMITSNIEISYHNNNEVMMHLHRSLYLALLFLLVGLSKWRVKVGLNVSLSGAKSILEDANVVYIQKAAIALFYLTSVFRFAEILEKVVYVLMGGGYLNYYISFASRIPGIIRKLGDFNEIIFFIFLATLPDPRRKKGPFVLFVLFGLLTLMYGQRNAIVTSVLMVIVYVITYENINDIQYQIIPKKFYRIGILSIPVLFLGLNAITYIRSGDTNTFGDIFSALENFLGNIGNSIRTIIFGYVFEDQIGHDKIYSLGSLTEFFRNNIIVKAIVGGGFNLGATVAQTEEIALNGYSFSNIVTYLYSRAAYLSGHGLGSSYIAEVYHDFGYIGVCISSIIYGKILKKVPDMICKNWVVNSVILISFYSLLMTPRDTACKFLASFINLQFLFSLILVWSLASVLKSRGGKLPLNTNQNGLNE